MVSFVLLKHQSTFFTNDEIFDWKKPGLILSIVISVLQKLIKEVPNLLISLDLQINVSELLHACHFFHYDIRQIF